MVLDRSKIEPLLLILGILGTDGFISYRKFIDFVNVNSPFPELKKEHCTFFFDAQRRRNVKI